MLALTVLLLGSLSFGASAQASCPHDHCEGAAPERKGTNYMVGTATGRLSELQFLRHDKTIVDADSKVVSLGGTYHSGFVAQEIRDLRVVRGVDRVRVFGSFWGWLLDPADYTSNLADFATICSREGMGLVFAPWSTTTAYPRAAPYSLALNLPAGAAPSEPDFALDLLRTLEGARAFYEHRRASVLADAACRAEFQVPWQLSWRAEPGNNYFHSKATLDDPIDCDECVPPQSCTSCTAGAKADDWPAWYEAKFEEYVTETATVFRDHMTTELVFDLMNEPEAIRKQAPAAGLEAAEVERLDDLVRTFQEMTYDRIHAAYGSASPEPAPRPGFTVGFAHTATLADDLLHLYAGPSALRLSAISFHSYEDPELFHAEILEARAAVAALEAAYPDEPELPLWCTEFFAAYFPISPVHTTPGSLAGLLNELALHDIEGFVWNAYSSNLLLDTNHLRPCTDPLFPDGFYRPIIEDPFGNPLMDLPNEIWEPGNTMDFEPTPGVVPADKAAFDNW